MAPTVTTISGGARSAGLVARELTRCALDRALPSRAGLPMRADGFTATWIEQVLTLAPGSIRSVRVVADDHGTASRARLELDVAPGVEAPNRLFAKFTPPDLQQRLLMNVMDLGAREVLFYDAVAGEVPVRVPRCYAVLADPRRGRNVMLLEDLSGTARFRDLREPLSAEQATAVVGALADLHAGFWQSPRFGRDLSLLVARSRGATFLADTIVPRFLANPRGPAADLVPGDVRAASRVFADRKPAIDAFWVRQPWTLTHGDPHLGNLFFEGEQPGFIDWQAVMAGPSIRDVAYFLNASVDVPVARAIERDLVQRYAARLTGLGIDSDPDRTWTLYRAAISEFYVAAVVTAGTGERMQPHEITRLGVERAVAAVEAHDTFAILAALASGRTP